MNRGFANVYVGLTKFELKLRKREFEISESIFKYILFKKCLSFKINNNSSVKIKNLDNDKEYIAFYRR